MFCHRIVRTISVACIFLALAETATADIVQCVDESGSVTYTDVPCKKDSETVRAVLSQSHEPPGLMPNSLITKFALAEKTRVAEWAGKRVPARRLPVDVAMMSAARAMMVSSDAARAEARREVTERRKS